MTSVFGDEGRSDPAGPVTMTPRAASDGGADSGGPGVGVDFFVTLGATLGTLADTLTADRQRRDEMEAPSNEQLFQAGIIPASGTLLLDLGSVPQGRIWQVRRLVVGGVAVTTSAAGAAYAFAQGAPPADLALTDCVDIFSTLPQGNTYGTHQLFLLPGEHLWVAFVGATAAQQYAASARVEDWADASFRSTFAE